MATKARTPEKKWTKEEWDQLVEASRTRKLSLEEMGITPAPDTGYVVSNRQWRDLGHAIMQKMFRVEGVEFSEEPLKPVLEWFSCASVDALYWTVGKGIYTARLVFGAAFNKISKENVVFLLPEQRRAKAVDESKEPGYTGEAPSPSPADTSTERMGDDLNKQEGVGARLLRELSPDQLLAVIEDSPLGRWRARFEERLGKIELPEGGFTSKAQADAVKALSSAFYELQNIETGLGLPPREKPWELREGERLRALYLRSHDEEGNPVPVRRRGRPRRDGMAVTAS